jgi:NADPH:quinone reductase
MRAIVLEKFGGLDSLVHKEIPDPEPMAGHVIIEIKAFGINHAELHMRRGEWAEAAKVIGIECVGLVKSCPSGEFPVGAKVAALMGPRAHDQWQLCGVHQSAGVERRPDRV